MYIEGYGYGRVEDRGGGIKGEHIDLYFPTHRQALQWGRQVKRVKVWPVPRS
jgi:3D (Asp-Asp-Asp) domain-containing protein